MGDTGLCGRSGRLTLTVPERFRLPLFYRAAVTFSAKGARLARWPATRPATHQLERGIQLGPGSVNATALAQPGGSRRPRGMPHDRPWLTLGRAWSVPARDD